MIAALLDTNVLASGIAGWRLQESSPGACLRRAIDRDFMLIISHELMQELDRTLRKTYFIRHAMPEDRTSALTLIRKIGILTERTAMVRGVATHP